MSLVLLPTTTTTTTATNKLDSKLTFPSQSKSTSTTTSTTTTLPFKDDDKPCFFENISQQEKQQQQQQQQQHDRTKMTTNFSLWILILIIMIVVVASFVVECIHFGHHHHHHYQQQQQQNDIITTTIQQQQQPQPQIFQKFSSTSLSLLSFLSSSTLSTTRTHRRLTEQEEQEEEEAIKNNVEGINSKNNNEEEEEKIIIENVNNNNNSNNNNNNIDVDDNLPRFLYIVTSGGSHRKNDGIMDTRWNQRVVPTILGTVQSLLQDNFCTVDVYLVLGFVLSPSLEQELRQQLPESVGLQIWNDATPYGYACNRDGKCANQQATDRYKKYGPRRLAKIQYGGAQLARQHRYVIKDKLPYYDFFLAFEDDMLILQSHVKQHFKWMKYLRTLQQQAPDTNTVSKDWREPLQKKQLLRFRPGFIRVEVLQQDYQINPRKPKPNKELLFPISNYSEFHVDPKYCCPIEYEQSIQLAASAPSTADTTEVTTDSTTTDSTSLLSLPSKFPSPLLGQHLMIWETTILGMGVRTLEPLPKKSYNKEDLIAQSSLLLPPPALSSFDNNNNSNNNITSITTRSKNHLNLTWVVLLASEPAHKRADSFWPGSLFTPTPGTRHQYANAKNLAQSAGWMGNPIEIMEYHTQTCHGGFLPPFNDPPFALDGWDNNVEFWSGGIQLWCSRCAIQRFIPLQEFDRHLLYHSSNNKQYKMGTDRQLLATDALGQLLHVKNEAIERLDWK